MRYIERIRHMTTARRTHTKIAWLHTDGTYYIWNGNWPSATSKTRSPLDAQDFSEYHHKDIPDLKNSMTCEPPYPQGEWVKIKIKTTATTIDH